MTSADILEKLNALHREYSRRLPEKLKEIDRACRDLSESDHAKERLKKLHLLVHKLAGSAGTFGFPELGEEARKYDHLLKKLSLRELPLDDGALVLLAKLPDALGEFVRRKGDGNSATLTETVSREESGDMPLVYILEDDDKFAQELAGNLASFGYRSRIFLTANDFMRSFPGNGEEKPVAVIADIMMPEGPLAGAEKMRDLQKGLSEEIPVYFLSAYNDFKARLAAVRAGGVGYFHKPADIGNIVDRLDHLTNPVRPDPYRVLIVDDDQELAEHYALALRAAGLETERISEPENILEALAAHSPELIIMDLYMPDCTGLELARLIRQEESYLGIPIIYLSMEGDPLVHDSALHEGADDFLTKPIDNERLALMARARAARGRVLNSLMSQDSLTGLLKHSRVKELLNSEMSRARRSQTSLVFAILDIDKFKAVNDTYGHLMGDRVIKTLARFLKQRLRKSDGIGRYGGEEFAVIFPETKQEQAVRILDELRENFSRLRFIAGTESFSVSFSAGVASFPLRESEEQNIQSADAALYRAKEAGRNRVLGDPGAELPS